MFIFLLGPPACGKGTQSAKLANATSIKNWSVGDLLRERALHDPEMKEMLASGKLVPAEHVNKIVATLLENSDNKSAIIDGYPRDLQQADFLFEKFLHLKPKFILLELNHDVLMNRVIGRFMCSKCDKLYNHYFNPAKDGICDQCGSTEFKVREDDKEEVFHTRMKEYENSTLPFINKYRKFIMSIDANQSMDKTFHNIQKALKII